MRIKQAVTTKGKPTRQIIRLGLHLTEVTMGSFVGIIIKRVPYGYRLF